QLVIECRAPWPTTTDGQSLLMLDVRDPSGKPGLIEDVIAACRQLTATPFATGQFYQAYLQLQREWNAATGTPRAISMMMAERALIWPTFDLTQQAPQFRKGELIYPILKRTFASH